MRGRVETGLECESHASPKDGGAEKSLSKRGALVHRDNGAAAQTASQPGGPAAAPEGAVETGSYGLRLRWRPHSQLRPQRILPAHPSREILASLLGPPLLSRAILNLNQEGHCWSFSLGNPAVTKAQVVGHRQGWG